MLRAQTAIDGAIAGRILDHSGKPLDGVIATAQELSTGLSFRAVSAADGGFLLVRVPAGEYELTIGQDGLESQLPEPVEVHLGETAEVQAHLTDGISGIQKSRPARTSGATDVTGSNLDMLPVAAGAWKSVAETNPGAARDLDDEDGEMSFRGVASTQNSTRLDGANAEDSFAGRSSGSGVEDDADSGGDEVVDRAGGVGSGRRSVADGGQRAGSSYTFAQSAVREFRVQGQADAAAYGSALYGHGVGGVVTTVSRSGTTGLHGMAFYTLRDSAWAAANPFALASTFANGVATSKIVKPKDLRQQFGGRIGGPLMEHQVGGSAMSRLFYFYAFDQQHRNFPAISSPGYGGFYTLTATQQQLLAVRGVSPANTRAALTYLNSLTGTVARRSDQTVNFGRLDWDRSGGSRLIGEYNRARWSSPGGARSGAVVDRGVTSIGSAYGSVDALVFRWVQFITPKLNNEVRAQYGHELLYEAPQSPLPQEPNVGPGGMPPEISIGPNGFVFGTPAALGQHAFPDERRLELAEVLGWVKGRHFLELGGDFSALRDFTDSLSNADGTFTYDSGNTKGHAGGLVDWITDYTFGVNAYPNGGCPSIYAAVHYFCFRSFSQSFGQQDLTFHTQEWAGFAQDDWRISDRLTLHAGARYEYEFLPLPQTPNPGLDAIFGTVGATSLFPEDRNNVGPRLGLEWSPFGIGHGVLRIGYGVYYGKLPGATVRSLLLNTAMASSTKRIRILPSTETACPQSTAVGFGYPCSFLAEPTGVVAATTSAMVFDRRFRLPMVQQGTFSFEHAVGGGVLGRVGYVMNLDRQLPNSSDINIAPSSTMKLFQLQGGTGRIGVRDGETFAVPVYTVRVTPSFGPVTDVRSNADATYHGLALEARRGLGGRPGLGGIGRGLEFRIAWTWSKAIDYGQNSGAMPRMSGQFDPFDVRYDKGLSALNFPQRVVGTVVWSPRWTVPMVLEKSGKLINTIMNGWSLAAIFSEGSGRGYSYNIFGGTRLAGGHESMNGSGGSVVLPTVGRNTLRLPNESNLDLRLSRSIRIGEQVHMSGSVEAFNATNHVNYSGVQQRAFLIGTPGTGTAAGGVTPLVFQDESTVVSEGLNVQPFGTFTDSGTSLARERQIQMSLRFEF